MLGEYLGKPKPKKTITRKAKPRQIIKSTRPRFAQEPIRSSVDPAESETVRGGGTNLWAGGGYQSPSTKKQEKFETGIVVTDTTGGETINNGVSIEVKNGGSTLDKIFSFGNQAIDKLMNRKNLNIGSGSDNDSDNRNNGGASLGFDIDANKKGIGFGLNLNYIAIAGVGILGIVLLYGMISGSKPSGFVRKA